MYMFQNMEFMCKVSKFRIDVDVFLNLEFM